MRLVVSGLINIETTLKIEGFPLAYEPVRYPFHGVNSTVAGVGYNISKALVTLGHDVRFLSLIGDDMAGKSVLQALAHDGISAEYVRTCDSPTAQSVILYDSDGKRMIHTDLKDMQAQVYPLAQAKTALTDCDLAILCNINFSRPLLTLAREMGVLVATDVHAIQSLDDPYNADFMQHADILFQSHERLTVTPEVWAEQVFERTPVRIVGVGLGANGALLATRDGMRERVPSVVTRPIVSTVGAGDALFASFLHTYLHTKDPLLAIRRAVVFASYKIGSAGAAEGFLDGETWQTL
jgi:acarbose 7IV-phosphotransferase